MKRIKFGDILTVERGIIVHGCNTLGAMGSGLALQIKQKWPECFEAYYAHLQERRHIDGHELLGDIIPYQVKDGLWVVNALTQLTYGRDSDRRYVNYAAVQKAFKLIGAFAWEHREHNLLVVNYPQIGAGLGNGDWGLIHEIINVELNNQDLQHTLWIREE